MDAGETSLLRAIEHCEASRAAKLNFCWYPQLTRIPRTIGNLAPHLKELVLFKNGIASPLPEELNGLSVLERLELSFNSLQSLDPGIGSRSDDSQDSKMPGNRVLHAPSLVSLKELYLNDNQIESLPPGISSLCSLELVHLSNNRLSALPPEISGLSALRVLDVAHNALEALPPAIGSLVSLQSLVAHHNALATLPPETGRLSALETLDVSANQLVALPPQLGDLTALESLEVFDNLLTALPPEIGRLRMLRQLQAGRNRLATLPAELGQLSALETLGLAGNDTIGALPFALLRLRESLANLAAPYRVYRYQQRPLQPQRLPLRLHARPRPLLDTCMQVVQMGLQKQAAASLESGASWAGSRDVAELQRRLNLPEELMHKLQREGRPCCRCERVMYGTPAWQGLVTDTLCHRLVKLEVVYCAPCGREEQNDIDSHNDINDNGGSYAKLQDTREESGKVRRQQPHRGVVGDRRRVEPAMLLLGIRGND